MRRSLSRWTLAASVAFAGAAVVTSGCKSSPLLAWFQGKSGPSNEAVVVDRGNEAQPPADGFTPHAGGESYANNAPYGDNQPAYGNAQGYGSPGYGAQGSGTRQASGYDAGGYAAAPVSGYDAARGQRMSDAAYGSSQNGYNANQYGSGAAQPAYGGYGADPRGYQDQSGGGYATGAGGAQGGYNQPAGYGDSAQQYQGGYDQGGYQQGAAGQGGYDQGSYNRGSQDAGYGGGYDASGEGGYGASTPPTNQQAPVSAKQNTQVANQLPEGVSANPDDYAPGSVRRARINQGQEQAADASYDAGGYSSQSRTQNGYSGQGGYNESGSGGSFGGGDFNGSSAGQDPYFRR